MAQYRFYHLHEGRIVRGQFLECADDEAALRRCSELVHERSDFPFDAVEIWLAARRVGVCHRNDKAAD